MSSRLRLHFPIVYRRLCLCDKSVNLGLKPDRLSKNVIGVEKHPRIGECCALLLQFSTLLLNKASDDVLLRTAYYARHTGLKNPWAAGHRTSRRLVAELCGGEHILALSQSGPEPDTHGLLFFLSQLPTTHRTRRPLNPIVVHEKLHHDYFTSHQNILLTNPRGKKKLQFVCFTCSSYDL